MQDLTKTWLLSPSSAPHDMVLVGVAIAIRQRMLNTDANLHITVFV